MLSNCASYLREYYLSFRPNSLLLVIISYMNLRIASANIKRNQKHYFITENYFIYYDYIVF